MSSKQRISPGPVGATVAANMEHLRKIQGLSYVEISRRMKLIGRPIAPLGLARIRDLQRRVDVDDLVALAQALDVNSAALLRPVQDGDGDDGGGGGDDGGGGGDDGGGGEWSPPKGGTPPMELLNWLNRPAQERGEPPPFPPNALIGPIQLRLRVRRGTSPIEIDLVPLLESLDAARPQEGADNGND